MKLTTKSRTAVAALALGMAAAGLAAPEAQAQQGFSGKSAGDIMVRARVIGVIPDEDATTSIGGNVSVSNEWVPEIDFTYFVTDNIALELIAATTRHDVSSSVAGSLGKVSLLPPTLTLQYHFMPKERLSPYVGAGVNYTIFYNEKPGPFASIDYKDSFGWALQAGVDYALTDNWYLNADIKKIFLSTDVSINGGFVTADVDLDPWIVGFGVGYKF